jgi:hypothetical protein
MRFLKLFATLAAATSVFASIGVQASTESFAIEWSGIPYGNHASATSEITLDTALIGVGNTGSIPIGSIQSFWITVLGSKWGDGTFSKSDFSAIRFNAPTTLDLDKELIGQHLGNGDYFGDVDGTGGEFNLFGNPANAIHVPSGTGHFQIVPDEYGGNGIYPLRVTSILPLSAVPEASEMMMSISGLALMIVLFRRRRTCARS